jgi:H+-translocating NAD(P) transhydrogenase subunit alpha
MSNGILEYLTVFVLAAFVGIEVVSKVPSILHTPLMSGSNAIHGVILVGSMLVLGSAHTGPEEVLGFLAVVLATLNVVGGFVVTDRMLEMFKGRAQPGSPGGRGPSSSAASGNGSGSGASSDNSSDHGDGGDSSTTGGATP